MKVSKVIFLGDSITLGYGLEDKKKRFSSIFCEMAQCEERNYGITGTLIARAGLSATNGTSFIDRYMDMEDGDFIIVFGGTNDYYWSDTDIHYFKNEVHELCLGIKKKYQDKPILFILPYRQRGTGNYYGGLSFKESNFHNSDTQNFTESTLAAYVDVLREACRFHNILVLDLYDGFGVDIAHSDEDFDTYTIDGCHPNENGHKRIAELLYEYCSNVGLL